MSICICTVSIYVHIYVLYICVRSISAHPPDFTVYGASQLLNQPCENSVYPALLMSND